MNINHEERWIAVRNQINSLGGNGNAIVEALQDYYTVFEDRMLVWLGGLYDPDLGGFYFSESSRDNEVIHHNGNTYPLLPDIESTDQATNILLRNEVFKSGMDFPLTMRKSMEQFICEKQDPDNGFFYHPQWPKSLTDSKESRRGRDLQWAISMSEKFEFKLPYLTPYERLGKKNESETEASTLPDYLLSPKSFLAYLKNFDWENEVYYSGNTISAQGNLINSAGLGKVAIDFLNSIQNPKTGLWGKIENGFEAINGYLKLSSFYKKQGYPIPNVDKAFPIAFDCATEPVENTSTVAYQFNVWFSISNIIDNMRYFGGVEGQRIANEAIRYQFNNCIKAIQSTKEKAIRFKKSNASYSYAPHKTSGTSQGMPVAILGTNEGDINASVLCSSGTARCLFEAMQIADNWIPIFSEKGQDVFMSSLKLSAK